MRFVEAATEEGETGQLGDFGARNHRKSYDLKRCDLCQGFIQ